MPWRARPESANREWTASEKAKKAGAMPAQAIARPPGIGPLESLQARGLIAKNQGGEVVDPMMLLWQEQNDLKHRP